MCVCSDDLSKGCVQISTYLDEKQKIFVDFSVKVVNFEKPNNKDRGIQDDPLHIRYGEVKNDVYKIGIHRPQPLVKVIVVAFHKSEKHSEHGNTKFMGIEWTHH